MTCKGTTYPWPSLVPGLNHSQAIQGNFYLQSIRFTSSLRYHKTTIGFTLNYNIHIYTLPLVDAKRTPSNSSDLHNLGIVM